jgi:hypothetical protein
MLVSNIGGNYRVKNSGQAQFVMFQFPASLTLIPVVRLVHLHICYLLSLGGLPVDNETTTLFSGGCCIRLDSNEGMQLSD